MSLLQLILADVEIDVPPTSNSRIDVLHSAIHITQDCILNRRGQLKTIIHTRDDHILGIPPDYEPPISIMEFRSHLNEPQIWFNLRRGSPFQIVDPERAFLLTPSAHEADLADLIRSTSSPQVVVGGFTSGDFRPEYYDLIDRRVSLGPYVMKIPSVLCEVLVRARIALE